MLEPSPAIDDGLQFDIHDPSTVDWEAIKDTVWRRYCGDEPVPLDLRVCPQCGVAFKPKAHNQVFCTIQHGAQWRYHHPDAEEFPRTAKCEFCGDEFEQTADFHRFCGDPCREKARHRRQFTANERYRERNKQRCREWYATHKTNHATRRAERKAAKHEETRDAKLAEKAIAPTVTVDRWALPAPQLDYLPGGAFTLDFRPRNKFEHWQLSALHGIMTAITGAHLPHMPRFALLPWHSGCGWAVYVGENGLARSIAGKVHGIELGNRPAVIHCGPLVRIKAPRPAPGVHILRVEAVTPVHIRCDNATVIRKVPTSNHLRGTLEGFMPRRLGIEVAPGQVALEMLENNTRSEAVRLAGNGRKLGDASGWVGSVTVKTNAVGRFLLECCALGLGYGGKVGFGFGRVRVTECAP